MRPEELEALLAQIRRLMQLVRFVSPLCFVQAIRLRAPHPGCAVCLLLTTDEQLRPMTQGGAA